MFRLRDLHKSEDGQFTLFNRDSCPSWNPLMNREKANLIVAAFDETGEEGFLIVADWMEENESSNVKDIERFRLGNWTDNDYDQAICALYAQKIVEYDLLQIDSLKLFIRWHSNIDAKFLKWISKYFTIEHTDISELIQDPMRFDARYGEKARSKYQKWSRYCTTEIQWENITMNAHKICCLLKKRHDAAAWRKMWLERGAYIRVTPYVWETVNNHMETSTT